MDETGIRGASQDLRGWTTWASDGGVAIEGAPGIAQQVARTRAEIEAILRDPLPRLPAQGRFGQPPRSAPPGHATALV